jgi:hypothetical protein
MRGPSSVNNIGSRWIIPGLNEATIIVKFVLTVIILLIMAGSLYRLYNVTIYHLDAPHDLFFETHNLATIRSIQAGASIYNPHFYNDLPFIITIYNPLFHYLVAALPQNPANPFFTGRFVSLLATLLAALLLFLPGNFKRYPAIPLLAISCFFLIREPVRMAAYLQSDTLAMFFSGLAVVCSEKACGNTWRILLCAFLCLLAFSTKQSFFTATVTCLVFLFCNDRKNAILFSIVSTILFAGFALFAQKLWGNGYWFSCYTSMLSHEMTLSVLLTVWSRMFGQPLFILLISSTILMSVYALKKQNAQVFRESPYLLYVVTSFLVLVAASGKRGADTNYFVEFILACLLWHVFLVRVFCPGLTRRFISLIPLTVLLVFATLESTRTEPHLYSFTDQKKTAFRQAVYEQAREEIKELRPPDDHFLNLNSPTAIYSLQSVAYVNDPFNYWLLWNSGLLDISALARAIETKYFSVIMQFNPENPIGVITPLHYSSPDSPVSIVFQMLKKHYVLKKKGVFLYFTPREQIG